MGLEAVMVVVDNSENSRNSDYTPTRYEAQADAVSVIFSAITQANPESAIGLMSMGGRGPEVLVTLTTDHSKILEALFTSHQVQDSWRNPVLEDEKKLIKLAQKIKKNSISIDFVVFGELNGKVENKLTVFNENVEGGARSHIAIMSPQSGLPGGMGDTSEGRYGREFEFGIDPSVDPELALALRMSIEEENARLEKQNKERAGAGAETETEATLPEIGEEDEEPQPPLDNEAEAGGSKDSCSR
ncbi:uncharacterized protein K444DRAFT_639147 [Hyaloscypha bicolor E]|uniref:VWFA domain-containing protein n=1 Tax=Hyaloscypha bicolor E TaxID=1095630 RepID=A0A2J6TVQ6_9HELO|nr:uncharacterized protein K444DRAFT_639147 [Hyaloscypha bicolor E]PMD67087.1 hypothetical protein K444DRAFT_639147 [Hyaloscypha bicolor E]